MALKIYTPTKPWQAFTHAYLSVRKKENRVLNDEEVTKLPQFSGHKLREQEWKIRAFSSRFLIQHVKKRFNQNTAVLEIGCGNGWLTNQLANAGFMAFGVDVNLPELEQAARVFTQPKVTFAFADVFEWQPHVKFEVVVLSAVLQYFPSPQKLFKRLFSVNPALKKIYILDTRFYTDTEKQAAQQRTKRYYAKHNAAEMCNHYHHFTVKDLGQNCTTIYGPRHKIFRKLIGGSPFYILEVTSSQ